MTLTETIVATLVWGLTAVGVLQIWVASGRALGAAESRQQALEVIDADLLRAGAQLLRLRSELSTPSADCPRVAASLAESLDAQPLAAHPGLSRQLRLEGEEIWLEYSFTQAGSSELRRRLLSPEVAGLCAADQAAGPGISGTSA